MQLPRLIFFLLPVLLSGCMTSFDLTQEARTLEPHTVSLRGTAGSAEVTTGVRYGIKEGWDAGAYYSVNYFAPSVTGMQSLDTKIRLINDPRYIISTGIGIGSGSDYLPGYLKSTENTDKEIDHAAEFFHRSIDVLLPVYCTRYFDVCTVYANIFGIYRIADREGNPINTIYPGFSIGVIDILKNTSLRFNTGISYTYYYAKDVPYPNNNPKKYLDGAAHVVDYHGGITWEFDPATVHIFRNLHQKPEDRNASQQK